jgi:hypothetical protein
MPLPTLTWAQGALHTNTTSPDAVGTLTTLVTAITAATKWRITGQNLAASPFWVEIAPIVGAGADIEPCRILFACSNATDLDCGIGSTSPATDWTGNGNNAPIAVVCAGICPNGSLATFNSAAAKIQNSGAGVNPYDGTAACRWSGYAKTTAETNITASDRDINQIYIVESEEIICVVFKNVAGPYWWGFIGGAMYAPPTDADGEAGTGGRLWGMACGGRQTTGNIHIDLASDIASWPNGAASGGTNSCTNGVFDPNSVDAKTVRRLNTIPLLVGAHATPYLTTQGGTIVHLSQSFRYTSASSNYVGTFRQIRKGNEAADRTIVQDAGANDKAYLVAASLTGADSMAFDNG